MAYQNCKHGSHIGAGTQAGKQHQIATKIAS